jgi:hypothetical protein
MIWSLVEKKVHKFSTLYVRKDKIPTSCSFVCLFEDNSTFRIHGFVFQPGHALIRYAVREYIVTRRISDPNYAPMWSYLRMF